MAQTTLAPASSGAMTVSVGNTLVNQLYGGGGADGGGGASANPVVKSTSDTDNSTTATVDISLNANGEPQPYATRVAPVTISWLINNYETAEGVSLPRSTLYTQYQKHCAETDQVWPLTQFFLFAFCK